jgi:hypothetical protein
MNEKRYFPSRVAELLTKAFTHRTTLLALISITVVQDGHATGFYGPQLYLDAGAKNLLQSPEFYWEVEVKRLAKNFTPSEKRIPIHNSDGQTVSPDEENTKEMIDQMGAAMTADADRQDFAAALKEGRIRPDDPAKATAQNDAARTFITSADEKTTAALPEEFPSEFADYHRGALAYKTLKSDEARAAWEALLKRPAEERHYRSVWAAFMLGKLALADDDPEAVKWFQATREFAKAGCADPLGLAADSYGWEARSELRQNHPGKAAELFLTQLATGDEGAIVSLKALIPDRSPVDGMLNYGPASEEDSSQWTDEQRKAEEAKSLAALKTAAKDPWLRQLVTLHILATESDPDQAADSENNAQTENKPQTTNRCARWLSIITEEHIEHLENADYLGWVAYVNGDYAGAERWLKLADPTSPAALWLNAKLLRRAGKLDEAAKVMVQAHQGIVPMSKYTGWKENQDWDVGGGHWSFEESVSGDLGALQLEQAQFIPALEAFLSSNGKDTTLRGERIQLWCDAAFVAERVLSTDELKGFVDRQPVPPAKTGEEDDPPIVSLRYLLGRRLVREDRYAEAGQYLKAPYDKVLAEYVKALAAGANEKLPKRQRAQAWFKAAWLARYDGMEIMGTEGAPDGFAESGDFEIPDVAKQQLTGFYPAGTPDDSDQKPEKHPIVLKPSKEELQRLSKTKASPDLRYHYRIIAGALAVRAAGLLQDNSEELADVLNTAGQWVKDRDEKLGDRYYQILKARAPKTKIGRLALTKHWFVNETGPWSEEQTAAEDKLHKDLGITTE